jgi:hypothetical protein
LHGPAPVTGCFSVTAISYAPLWCSPMRILVSER